MIDEYEYNISLVIPVSKEDLSLSSCIEKIKNQSCDLSKVEVVLIGYGNGLSEDDIKKHMDSSSELKISYYPSDSKNKAAANNFARKYTAGKYILFMNAEDSFNESFIYNLVKVFDSVQDQTDILLPYICYINEQGAVSPDAAIYSKYLLNTGVYSISEMPVAFRDIVPCIKNSLDVYWDEDLDYHEDKVFFFEATSKDCTFGYAKEAKYYRSMDGDSNKNYLRTFKRLSESIISSAEKIISFFDNDVEYGAQSSILYYFNEHVMDDDSFWPHHYDKQEYDIFEQRVKYVLFYIDVRTILCMDFLDKYSKTYWIKQKPDKCVEKIISDNCIKIDIDKMMLENRKDVEWTLRRILVQGKEVTLYGDFKLALFDFLSCEDELEFEVVINGKIHKKLDVKPSFAGYPKGSRIKMNDHWAFNHTFSTETVKKIEMSVVINGQRFVAKIVNCYNTVFGSKLGLTEATVGNILIKQSNKKTISFEYISDLEVIKRREKITEKFVANKYVCNLRRECDSYFGRRIWLYNDNFAMFDNAFYLFSHDLEKNDGVERYYIIKDKSSPVYVNADDSMRDHFLIYGSREHILLFLNAEKIFTAFTSGLEWRALQHNEMYQYWDIFKAEIILLSHGVLNQYWPWAFSPIRMPIDKIVISTEKEKEAWEKNGFWEKDFIYSGMPRYEVMIKEAQDVKPKRRIVIALSWRMYLAGKHEILLDAATPRIALDDRYVNSSYFNNFMSFLNDKKLEEYLEKYDVDIDVNLHPQFNLIYRDHIKLTDKRIHLTDGSINLAEYMAMISDVSSIIFDFALFKRPIQYFIPDIEDFKAGCNHFRELILPFEDGLGPYAVTVKDAVDNLCELISNDFEMPEEYRSRFDNLHIALDEPCEKIYQYCK